MVVGRLLGDWDGSSWIRWDDFEKLVRSVRCGSSGLSTCLVGCLVACLVSVWVSFCSSSSLRAAVSRSLAFTSLAMFIFVRICLHSSRLVSSLSEKDEWMDRTWSAKPSFPFPFLLLFLIPFLSFNLGTPLLGVRSCMPFCLLHIFLAQPCPALPPLAFGLLPAPTPSL